MPRRPWIETVSDIDCLGRHDLSLDRDLGVLHLPLGLLYATLQVINLHLSGLARVPAPNLPSLRLVRDPVDRFLLLVVR